MIAEYLIFGAGFYIGLALNNPTSFMDVDTAALFRGILLCFIFWPIGLIVKLILLMGESNDRRKQ